MTFINGFQPLTNVTKILQRSIDVEEVVHPSLYRGGSRSAPTSKMEHIALNLGCCRTPRSVSVCRLTEQMYNAD